MVLKFIDQYSRGNVDINHLVDGLGTVSCIEDDLGGQRRPLPDVLGVSQDPANRVLRVGPELLVEVVVVIDSDVGARRNGQETIG